LLVFSCVDIFDFHHSYRCGGKAKQLEELQQFGKRKEECKE
jgi:hypothetical protein